MRWERKLAVDRSPGPRRPWARSAWRLVAILGLWSQVSFAQVPAPRASVLNPWPTFGLTFAVTTSSYLLTLLATDGAPLMDSDLKRAAIRAGFSGGLGLMAGGLLSIANAQAGEPSLPVHLGWSAIGVGVSCLVVTVLVPMGIVFFGVLFMNHLF